jgi:transcriptional regulator with XRE-family HTH domain
LVVPKAVARLVSPPFRLIASVNPVIPEVYFEFTYMSTLNLPVCQIYVYSVVMSIGKRIAQLRKAAGLSQDQLGEQMRTHDKPSGLTKQAVLSWEKDRNQLTVDQVVRLSEIFGVSIEYIISGKESGGAEIQQRVDRLDKTEDRIIQSYRTATVEGKAWITEAAEAAEKLPVGSLANNKS